MSCALLLLSVVYWHSLNSVGCWRFWREGERAASQSVQPACPVNKEQENDTEGAVLSLSNVSILSLRVLWMTWTLIRWILHIAPQKKRRKKCHHTHKKVVELTETVCTLGNCGCTFEPPVASQQHYQTHTHARTSLLLLVTRIPEYNKPSQIYSVLSQSTRNTERKLAIQTKTTLSMHYELTSFEVGTQQVLVGDEYKI